MTMPSITVHQNIPPLTGIRGFASVWVTVFHVYPLMAKMFNLSNLTAIPVIRSGFMGVDLFFILSGFVLMMTYGENIKIFSSSELQRFAFNRLFRILPLHWFVLGILALLVLWQPHSYWGPGPFSTKSFIASFFLVQAWGFLDFSNAIAWNSPAWSLSAEWAAYFIFPFQATIMQRTKNISALTALALICFVFLVATILCSHSLTLDHAELGGLVRCLTEFSMGVCICNIWRLRRAALEPWGAHFLLAGFFLFALSLAITDLQLLAPVAFACFVLGCAIPSQTSDKIFGNRIAVFLGNISFSLYLTHSIVINAAQLFLDQIGMSSQPLQTRICIASILGLLILLTAFLTWMFIERPAQIQGKRISRQFSIQGRFPI